MKSITISREKPVKRSSTGFFMSDPDVKSL
jgi:hypothetical protein